MGQIKTIRAVDDALSLLSEVGMAGGMTATEIEKAAGLTRDKTYRLIKTLKCREWLSDLGDGQYGLGHRMALLWAAYRDRLSREVDKREQQLVETEIRNA